MGVSPCDFMQLVAAKPRFFRGFFIACICARLPCGCTSARLGAKLGMFDLLMRCFFVVGTCYPCCQSRSSQRGSHAWPRPSINSMASGNHCDYRDNLAEKALEQNSAVSDMHKLLEHRYLRTGLCKRGQTASLLPYLTVGPKRNGRGPGGNHDSIATKLVERFASAILCGNDPADLPYHLTEREPAQVFPSLRLTASPRN